MDMKKTVKIDGDRAFSDDEIKSTVITIDNDVMSETSKGSIGEDELHETVFKALSR